MNLKSEEKENKVYEYEEEKFFDDPSSSIINIEKLTMKNIIKKFKIKKKIFIILFYKFNFIKSILQAHPSKL
jgi:hypothetical protein